MKVFVAGHTGLVGQAVSEALTGTGHTLWLPDNYVDFRNPALTRRCMMQAARAEVDAVVLAAARVGGIGANTGEPVEFLRDNLLISLNVISQAHEHGIERLVNLGSSCIYPRGAAQPMVEEALLTGPLEPTNEPYALAKICAVKLVQAYRRERGAHYISLMPCNLYGPGDRYDPRRSHVIPSLIWKFERARVQGTPVVLWGTGAPHREFLHVRDLARAVVVALAAYDGDLWLNVGSDEEVTIRDLAALIADATGYHGPITWDASMPDGTPRKKVDWTRMGALGWAPAIPLGAGLREAVADFRARNLAATFPAPSEV